MVNAGASGLSARIVLLLAAGADPGGGQGFDPLTLKRNIFPLHVLLCDRCKCVRFPKLQLGPPKG